MALALAVALADDGALSDLAEVQNDMRLHAVFVFLLGLFAMPTVTPHAWVIALGTAVSFINHRRSQLHLHREQGQLLHERGRAARLVP
eukprot:6207700-Pleurochrysis_carterae.AAC.5